MKLVIQIFRELNGLYLARCTALPGCQATGKTADEAADRVAGMIESYLVSFNAVSPSQLEREVQDSSAA